MIVVKSDADSEYENYEEFLIDRARVLCAADSPTETINCTDVERQNTFTSASGLTGDEFYLTLTRQNLASGTTTSATFGPIYAFAISPNVPESDHAALLVYQPLATYLVQPQPNFVRSIANSITVDRIETP